MDLAPSVRLRERAPSNIESACAAKLRRWLGVGSLCGALLIVSYNAWLATRGIDARAHTIGLFQSLVADNGRSIGIGLGAIVLLLIATAIAIRILCRIMDGVAYLVDRWGRLEDDKQTLAGIFDALNRTIVTLGWLVAAVLACRILRVPEGLIDGLMVVIVVYLVIALGLVVIRSTEVVLKAADRIIEGHARAATGDATTIIFTRCCRRFGPVWSTRSGSPSYRWRCIR